MDEPYLPELADRNVADTLRDEYEPKLQGVRDAWVEAIVDGNEALAKELSVKYQKMQAEYIKRLVTASPAK